MTTTTAAIVFESADRVSMRDIAMPPPGPGEVQVRTRCSSISCGTEGWVLGNRFTWAATPFPCVPGYQRTGDIVAVGEGVTGWHVGQHVLATIGAWKGPVVPFWGSHAGVANTPASEIYSVPAGADEPTVAAAVVAQVGYNAAYRPMIHLNDWVIVYGDGLIGQFAAQAARTRGANVVLVGHRSERLDRARLAGIPHAVSGGPEAGARIRQCMDREHASVIIDTVQTPACQQDYLPLLENGKGQIVYSGFSPGESWASMAALQQRELTAHFVSGWNRQRMEATLALIGTGQLTIGPLMTHRVPASHGVDIWRQIVAKSPAMLGVVLEW